MFPTNGASRPGDDLQARTAMVREQLQRRGITDTRVLRAMQEVPRHLFVPPEWRRQAYRDSPLPIAAGQTISQPYMVALMLQSLAIPHAARILEIGTGSGYQSAILSRLATQVYTIEYFPVLAEQARALLGRLGHTNVLVLLGDGGPGLPVYAPYHGIVVAAAAPHLPQSLIGQLCEGGRLVIPVGEAGGQELRIITRRGPGYTTERSVSCRFVPLLGQEGRG
jgi:protein-L-isoaspartate(D-aspartate) O-methyltransferase